MTESDTIRPQLDRWKARSFAVGAISLVLGFVGMHTFSDPVQFHRSFLFAFIFWMSFPLGCISILMLHNLTGGWWGHPIRRFLEAGTRTFWLMAVLFVVNLLAMSKLYPWTQGTDKPWYLNRGFFTLRAAIYFTIWLLIAYFLNKWSAQQDRATDSREATRFSVYLEAMAGPAVILWGIAVTFSSVDWVMSLEPHWFSTIYGMIFMMVSTLAAMCFVLFILRRFSDREPISTAVTAAQFNDLGNLVLAFLMLWAYLSFDQFLIIWAGNTKDEIPWYMSRANGGWTAVAVALIVLHFALPFFLLLQRRMKRRLRALSALAAMILVMALVDVYWLVVPAWSKQGPQLHITDLLAVLGIGGLWLGLYFMELAKRPLLPLHDPRFEGQGVLEHEHGD